MLSACPKPQEISAPKNSPHELQRLIIKVSRVHRRFGTGDDNNFAWSEQSHQNNQCFERRSNTAALSDLTPQFLFLFIFIPRSFFPHSFVNSFAKKKPRARLLEFPGFCSSLLSWHAHQRTLTLGSENTLVVSGAPILVSELVSRFFNTNYDYPS